MLRNMKFAIPIAVLAALFLFITPPQASAKVHFGVYVGPPTYTYPAYPYAYGYPYGYNYPYAYGYPYDYYYPSYGYRVYSYPRYSFGHARHEWREHREHEWREHHRR
jgi:hypothetical protein